MDTFLSLLGLVGFFAVFGIVLGIAAGIIYAVARWASARDRAEAEARRSAHSESSPSAAGH